MNPDWVVPTAEDVSRVVGSLVDDNLRRLFFAELQNPNWVMPLAELGMFASAPEVWMDEQGAVRARQWPEGEYLARVAPEEPAAVAEILARIGESENPWINAILLDATRALPPEHANRLVPQIVGAIRSGGAWIDAEVVVRLAESLAAEYPEAMRKLLAAAFEPKAGGENVTSLGFRIRVDAVIDSYWYAELAPRAATLLAGLGMDGLRSAVRWLMRAIDIASGGSERGDLSYIWRPSIAPHAQNSDIDEVTGALVDIVRDVAIGVAKTGSVREVVEFLEARDRALLRRIAVEASAQSVADEKTGEPLDVARHLVMDESLFDMEVRPEYVHLALATLPLLSEDDLASWRRLMDDERWHGPPDFIRRLAAGWDNDPADVSDDDIAATRRRLRYRLLLPLQDVLPPELRAELTKLRADFGELEHPEFASYSTSFSGPTSPVDHVALSGMSPDELFDFLNEWKAEEDHGFGPSVEGLARQLAVAVETHPGLLAAIAPRLLGLPRSYVKATLDGWAKAIPAGFDPPTNVWLLLVQLVRLPDSGEDVQVDFDADDPVWRWAQRNAIDVATAYLSVRGEALTTEEAQRIWIVVAPVIDHADPTPEHEERFGGSNMDPLTLSLNTTRPAAIRAATKLLRQLKNHDSADDIALRTEILELLSRHVSHEDDPSLAVSAVFGEAIGYLWDIHRAWVEDRTEALFGVLSDDDRIRTHADVVVSVALRVYRTSSAFIELMRGVMTEMFSSKYTSLEHTEGWQGKEPAVVEAASHVLRAYVIGVINEEDLLLAALMAPEAPPRVFAQALSHLGWEIMRAARDREEPLSPDVLERAKRLIDHRATEIMEGRAEPSELAGFYWWVRAEVYPPSWSLPILLLATTDPHFDPKGMLGEALSRVAEVEPALTIEVLEALLRRNGGEWRRYDIIRHAAGILAAALLSGDEAAGAKARDILNRLGREGHMSILADVDRLTGSSG